MFRFAVEKSYEMQKGPSKRHRERQNGKEIEWNEESYRILQDTFCRPSFVRVCSSNEEHFEILDP